MSLLSLFWPMARTLHSMPRAAKLLFVTQMGKYMQCIVSLSHPMRYWRSTAHQHVTWSWSKSNHHSERSPALGLQTSDPGPLWASCGFGNGWCLQCQVYPWSIPGKASSLAGKSCGFVHVSIMFLMFAGKWVEMKLTSYSIYIYIDGHCSCKNILSSNICFLFYGFLSIPF